MKSTPIGSDLLGNKQMGKLVSIFLTISHIFQINITTSSTTVNSTNDVYYGFGYIVHMCLPLQYVYIVGYMHELLVFIFSVFCHSPNN